ncbi:MAG: glucokinase [Alphaproteobacteria bacterium]|nr:glucokinase [Alphaproteobacteria bacterium]
MSQAASTGAGETRLVGDVGATNARFGLVSADGAVLNWRTHVCDQYPTIDDALAEYLADRASLPMPRQGAIAIASAITGDRIEMTNHPWSFSVSALRSRFGFERLEVINDFTAQALALPHLGPSDRMPVGGGIPVPGTPLGVLGPGSGLGVSGLVPHATGWLPLTGEGGHATMPAANDREAAVIDHLRRRLDHVSAERLLSGPGLVNLYNTLAELDGIPSKGYTAPQITEFGMRGEDPICAEATAMFCAMLGTVAGDLALTLGARGGVFIAGGIVPRFGRYFPDSPFRSRFEAKGRFAAYLAAIPTWVVTHPLAAFLGCAALLAG